MEFEKHQINTCCGGTNLILKLKTSIDLILRDYLISNNFKELATFTAAGILYVDNLELIVTGPIGSNKLQVKCKKANCTQQLNDFEDLLRKF